MPIAIIRALIWVLTHTLYRISRFHPDLLPRRGGALLVCNHVSYLDPILVSAAAPRPLRFLISRRLFEAPVLGAILRRAGAIPISSGDGPKALLASLAQARDAVRGGEVVCIFAEGEPSRLGHMLSFGRGLERIMRGVDFPIVPAYLDQPWGGLLDFRHHRPGLKLPRELPYPVSITFGPPLPPSSTVFQVRQAVAELGTSAFAKRRREQRYLHLGFVDSAKRRPFKTIMADSSGRSVTNLRALTASYLLAGILKRLLPAGPRHVGVLLPTGIPGVLTNAALTLKGFIPVNLNYTAGKEALHSACVQSEITHVVTSRLFITKVIHPDNAEFLYVEDLLALHGPFKKLLTALMLLLIPARFLRYRSQTSGTPEGLLATVIFSSGSSGSPKGVMLTHTNVSSNVEAAYEDLGLGRKDVMAAVLPFFHSFGYATGVWLPLLSGIKTLYHYNPLDGEALGQLVAKHRGTLLLSTPTFAMNYVKRVPKEQFASLRLVIVGAEKLKTQVSEAFEEKFGLPLLEGYGTTELSPIAMFNVPSVRLRHREQVGHKRGTVGHPIPGVAVKIVDPESMLELLPGETGLLLVKGPNVMKGYLKQPELTGRAVRDGWYVTGDLASMDKDGFVTLHGRLSRFSKIAGEMVPHGVVEEALQRILSEQEQVCVVTGIPDDRRGERLVVLHTVPLDARAMNKGLAEQGLPNLWIPRCEDFHLIPAIPLLGSGKVDLKTVRQIAEESSKPAKDGIS